MRPALFAVEKPAGEAIDTLVDMLHELAKNQSEY
jgi:hypothetical protein